MKDPANNKLIRVGPCVGFKAKTFSKQQWDMDEYNQLHNAADDSLCMRAKRNLSLAVTILKLSPCVEGQPEGLLTQFIWDPFLKVLAWKKDITTVLSYDSTIENPLQISDVQLENDQVISGQRWDLEG